MPPKVPETIKPQKGSDPFCGYKRGLTPLVARHLASLLLGFAMTAGLFAMVPWMIGTAPGKNDLERLVSVQLRELRPPEPEKKEPEPPKVEEEKPPEPEIPMERMMQKPPEVKPLDLPAFRPDLSLSAVAGPTLAPPPPPGPMTYEAGEVDQTPRTLVQMPPVYPFRARRMGIEGWVRVRFLVDTEGRPGSIQILEAEPAGVFEDAVVQAISGWRFEAAVKDGRRVASWVVTPIRFQLGGAS